VTLQTIRLIAGYLTRDPGKPADLSAFLRLHLETLARSAFVRHRPQAASTTSLE
jgi:hypothetical protein